MNSYVHAELTGLARAQLQDRETEAITGNAALEFSVEAKTHPERYQYLADYITRLFAYYNLRRVMDFGCGPGILTAMIAKQNSEAQVVGIDLSVDMLTHAELNTQGSDVPLVHFDVKQVYVNASELADIVISRNMLHRLEVLQEGLMAMARACKPKGGIVFSTSFRNLNDLGETGQKRWLRDFHERDGYPALQLAWVLAYLNAPTLQQYRASAKKVAYALDAEDLRITAGKRNEVNIFLRRKSK